MTKVEAPRLRDGMLAHVVLGVVLLMGFTVRAWYGSSGLDTLRFFDERYTLENVDAFLQGAQRPVSGWYPSLAYLPHVGVLYATDRLSERFGLDGWQLKRSGTFSVEALRVCRHLQAIYGTVSLWLVFLIARRMFDPATGLIATLVLTFTPGHIQLSAIVKPDILMIVFLQAIVLVALRLTRRLSVRTTLLGGVLLGLAVSAKQYGVVGAIPLCAGVLLGRSSWRSRVALTGSALAAAALVFLAINPWVGTLIDFAARNRRIYAGFSQGHVQTFIDGLLYPTSVSGHGLVLGVVALVGIGVLVASLIRDSTLGAQRDERVLFLITTGGYIALCATFLTWSKYNLWVPLSPLTATAAGFALATGTRYLGRVAPPATAILGAVSITLIGLWPSLETVYKAGVPTVEEKARSVLREQWKDGRHRLVYQEGELQSLVIGWSWHKKFAVSEIDRLSDLEHRVLDLADAELFPWSRLEGEDAEFYRQRLKTHAAGVTRIDGGWFRARGEDLVLVDHAWERSGDAVDVVLLPRGRRGRFAGQLPNSGRKPGVVSLELQLPSRDGLPAVLKVAGVKTALHRSRWSESHSRYLSPRLVLPPGRTLAILVRLPAGSRSEDETLAVRVHPWRWRSAGKGARN